MMTNHVYRVKYSKNQPWFLVVLPDASKDVEADIPKIKARLVERHGPYAMLNFSAVEYLGYEWITEGQPCTPSSQSDPNQ